MDRLAGKVAIITGAAQGIGKGIAKVMATQGARIALFDVADSVVTAAEDIRSGSDCQPGDVRAYRVDITDAGEVKRGVETVLRDLGGIDILVNDAAVVYFAPFLETTDEMMEKTFDVNFRGMWNCAKAVLPTMIAQRQGRIINLSSAAAITSSKGLTAYSASKGAICAFTRALSLDLAEFGINVNAIVPCYVATEGLDDIARTMGVTPQAYLDKIGSTIPLGRLASVEEIGDLAVFLASKESAYITGQEIVIDGGNLIQTKKGDF